MLRPAAYAIAAPDRYTRDAESGAIKSFFPDLGAPTAKPAGRTARTAAAATTPAKPRAAQPKTRRTMSAAERKAVSERMKKYWAERRKAKAGQKK
jgi:hypothetical protein